jgi:hypothetical protein
VEDFSPRLGLRDSLELYLFLQLRETELGGASAKLYSALRAYLYERLSIEEMESPELLLRRL